MGPKSRQDRAGGAFTGKGGESGGGIVFGPLAAKTPNSHARLTAILPVKPSDREPTPVDFIAAAFFAILIFAFVMNSVTSCVDRYSRIAATIQKGDAR